MKIAIVAGGFQPARPMNCAAPWRAQAHRNGPELQRKEWSAAWSKEAARRNSPSAASSAGADRVSATIWLPEATRPPSPCWSMPRAGSRPSIRTRLLRRDLNSQPMGLPARAARARRSRLPRREYARRCQSFAMELHAGGRLRRPHPCASCRDARRQPAPATPSARLPADQRALPRKMEAFVRHRGAG